MTKPNQHTIGDADFVCADWVCHTEILCVVALVMIQLSLAVNVGPVLCCSAHGPLGTEPGPGMRPPTEMWQMTHGDIGEGAVRGSNPCCVTWHTRPALSPWMEDCKLYRHGTRSEQSNTAKYLHTTNLCCVCERLNTQLGCQGQAADDDDYDITRTNNISSPYHYTSAHARRAHLSELTQKICATGQRASIALDPNLFFRGPYL